MKMAARVGDINNTGGPILMGATTVLIGGKPAAIATKMTINNMMNGAPDPIIMGSTTVLIENMPAVRVGDPTAGGATIAMGCPTVLIGG
ncbi:MAG: PAAR domain-containing protein [Raineya sp.]|jgi:uncharacterized Zn-binding protein involved in type VI secretion|nr:PAAR domain-containing protein [Raineya sp.]